MSYSDNQRTLLLSGTGLGLIFGVVLAMMVWQKHSFYSILNTPARKITCKELLASDDQWGGHIKLTDFVFGQGYAAEKKAGHWSKVFIPVFAADEQPPQKIEIIVESWDIGSEDELKPLLQRPELSGILLEGSSSFGLTAGSLVQKANPGMSLTTARRIQYFTQRPSIKWIRISAIASICCFLLGGICFMQHRRRQNK